MRLILTSIIGLYSSRLVLQELGVYNFGLYGIVGGIVALLSFLNSSMITTSNRFIAVELGKKENQNINKILLSSIFKKNNNFLGVYRFKLLSLLTKKPVIALGGISNHNLKKLNHTNCIGFAGISFFE